MEFTAEQIQELKITDDQVKSLNDIIESHIAEQKKEWDGKANKDANNILDDKLKGVMQLTGIQREQGQRAEDYLKTASEAYVKGVKESLIRKEKELEDKIKLSGDDMTKKELEKAKGELDSIRIDLDKFKEKAAKYDEIEASGIKEKYESTVQELSGLKLNMAFSAVKPSFPDSVNSYEAAAKWKEFVEGIKEKNNIELDKDGVAWAVDKENEHIRVKLESLVEKDKTIQELAKGRQMQGLRKDGVKGDLSVEGLPFKIDSTMTPADIQNKIRDYISNDLKISISSRDYSTKFSEYYNAIKKAQQTA